MRESSPTDPLADAFAVRGVLAGRTAEYETLFRRHAAGLRRRALSRLRDEHTADDMVQEAFLRSFRNLGQLKDPLRFGPWLLSILDNVCREHYRQASSRPRTLSIGSVNPTQMVIPAAESMEVATFRGQLQQTVREVCCSLRPALRVTALLYYVGGLSCEQIAQAIQVPLATIESRLHKARAEIRQLVLGRARSPAQRRSAEHLISLVQEVYVMDTIRIEIAADLVPLVHRGTPERNMLELIREIRKQMESDQSIQIPKVHVIDNQRLPPKSYSIFVREQPVADGTITDLADLTAFSTHLRRTILEHRDGLSGVT